MAYEPTVWQCGDTITAEKLNKLEQAAKDAEPLIFTAVEEEILCPDDPSGTALQYTYSHSWQEIYDALVSGRPAYAKGNTTQEEGGVVVASAVYLDQIMSARMDSSIGEYAIETTTGANCFFEDATSKVYSECGGK